MLSFSDPYLKIMPMKPWVDGGLVVGVARFAEGLLDEAGVLGRLLLVLGPWAR